MPEEKTFPLVRILTVSARDYVESVGKTLGDYKMVGVQHFDYISPSKPHEDFASKVPSDAEVVSYNSKSVVKGGRTGSWFFNAEGTALIPKTREELQKDRPLSAKFPGYPGGLD